MNNFIYLLTETGTGNIIGYAENDEQIELAKAYFKSKENAISITRISNFNSLISQMNLKLFYETDVICRFNNINEPNTWEIDIKKNLKPYFSFIKRATTLKYVNKKSLMINLHTTTKHNEDIENEVIQIVSDYLQNVNIETMQKFELCKYIDNRNTMNINKIIIAFNEASLEEYERLITLTQNQIAYYQNCKDKIENEIKQAKEEINSLA